MTEPTGDEIARWAALAEQATPGPWSADDEHGNMPGAEPAWCVSRMDGADGRYLGDLAYTVGAKEQADARFIAEARTAVPRLLALVAAQAEQIAELRAAVDLAETQANNHAEDAILLERAVKRVRALCDRGDFERDAFAASVGSGDAPTGEAWIRVRDVRAALDGTGATL